MSNLPSRSAVVLLSSLALLLAGCPESTPARDAGDDAEVFEDIAVDHGLDAEPDVPDAAETPGEIGDVPADVEEEDGSEVPGETEDEASDVPVDGSDVPVDGSDVPVDGSDVPVDGLDVPVEVEDVPADVAPEADVEEDVVEVGDASDADGSLDPCPDDMVAAGAVCIDRYEASRVDATAASVGIDETTATSRAGVQPWFVNPFDTTALATFEAACNAAGKRLCRAEEWQAACAGPSGLPFVYGDTFDREACNCVDTFCDDHCVAAGIPAASCDTAADCGYRYFCFHVEPTGSYPSCTNAWGTFDLNGNVWEIVRSTADSRGFEVRGGAYNCAMAALRVNCTFNAGWLALNAGFRCCKDR